MEFLTLIEAAKSTQNPLRRGVIETFARTSPVLERLPFMGISGNAYTYNLEESLGGVAFRGVNESYTHDIGVINPVTERLTIMGGLSKVDRALVKTQGNVNSVRALYDGMKAKAAALLFSKKFFKGDSLTDPKEFDGLETRLTGDQVIDMDGILTLAKLDQLIDQVAGSPDVLFMNKILRRRVNALRRSAGQATEVVNDAFGRQIPAYASIPIGVIEEDENGDEILEFDEKSSTSSIYAVRFGAGEYVSGLQSGSMDVIDLGLTEIFYMTLIEHICGLAVFHPKSAARLKGITDPDQTTTTTTV
jgi:hypothetical protein